MPVVANNQLVVAQPILFGLGSDVLLEENGDNGAVLEQVRAYLASTPLVTTMRIEGHTEDSGNEAASQKLSERRALSVARWLAAKGIDCTRLLPVGFGASKPVESNDTLVGKAANRRVAFVIAALNGHAIGGMPLDGGGAVAGDPCK